MHIFPSRATVTAPGHFVDLAATIEKELSAFPLALPSSVGGPHGLAGSADPSPLSCHSAWRSRDRDKKEQK